MKKFIYVLIAVCGIIAASCTEEVVAPHENDPVAIPPPPPKP
jgi:hypothetical protein